MRLRKSRLPLLAILLANFASEIAHGILTHRLGTDQYAPLTVGDVVRGLLLVLLLGYTLATIRHLSSRILILAYLGLALWVAVQTLVFGLSLGEILTTFKMGLQWLYLFVTINAVVLYVRRYRVPYAEIVSMLKWLIIVFYSLPIYLAALGIAGYTVYGPDSSRQGYAGFVMNQNVVAGAFVFMLPFYLGGRRLRDYLLLIVFLGAGLLLGSKLVYIGFAVILAAYLAQRVWLGIRRMRSRKTTVIALALSLLVVGLLPVTPFWGRLQGIYKGLSDLFGYYLSGGPGYQSSVLDVLTSYRTFRVVQLWAWAQRPENLLALLIGGGAPTYAILYGEVNWIDMIGGFGLLGLILFYGAIGYLLFRVYRAKANPYRAVVFWTMLLTVVVSSTSGHTYDGPVVGIMLGCLLGGFFATTPSARASPMTRQPQAVVWAT